MFRKGDNPKARLTVSGVWSLESSGEVIIFGRYTPMLLHSNLLLVDSYISCATRMAMHSHAFALKTPRKNDHYDAPLKLYSVSSQIPFWAQTSMVMHQANIPFGVLEHHRWSPLSHCAGLVL